MQSPTDIGHHQNLSLHGLMPQAPIGSTPVTRTCCGHEIEPRVTLVPHRSGKTFLAYVWQCPSCSHVSFWTAGSVEYPQFAL